MVSRPAGFRRRHPGETHAGEIEFVHEHIDYTNWIIPGHVVVQVFGQQRALSAVLAVDKALHLTPVLMRDWHNVYYTAAVYATLRFYTA